MELLCYQRHQVLLLIEGDVMDILQEDGSAFGLGAGS